MNSAGALFASHSKAHLYLLDERGAPRSTDFTIFFKSFFGALLLCPAQSGELGKVFHKHLMGIMVPPARGLVDEFSAELRFIIGSFQPKKRFFRAPLTIEIITMRIIL
jgi:hypothetical protein